ncbi:hypothetical protein [Acinetobacter indicus]|uniref:hypothetical protein n=1 Tax=Acinetobacter indicus TaxID=756892 RepID=UPI0013D47A29|nr:hypothetical protein [Acinetobacter indicus]
MVKKLPGLLDSRSPDRQTRILENAKIILKDCVMDDEVHLFQLQKKRKVKKLSG